MRDETTDMGRRSALGALATAAAMAGAAPLLASAATTAGKANAANASGGRLKQSLSRWTSKAPLPELCKRLKAIGFVGVDLLYADEWSVVQDHGMAVSMGYPAKRDNFIEFGFNDPANHAQLIKEIETTIPLAKRAGVTNIITMFGNRKDGIDDQRAIDNCIAGLSKIAPYAAENGITLCLELLNSKVDHHGYQGDHTAFGVAVTKGLNSPNVKLLYDIYHMQIMEGDVIRTIRDHIQWIGHFHTGGVPGRHEIDGTQELNYHAVAKAIADLNYQGFIAHEFSPTRPDPFASFAEAFKICTV
ncbi:hydroxypyruvate isomerase family protein [Luteibacter aegosomatissinici]|uniref:hydroxypyruvate isomerase family protein n=1 Tax=Luteibacter aegosomatissinici TaxID=2911539 RepID=UPI001FF9ECAC|nr:TIM barrel protein [Luteibacter aegosomatissinici]UPG94736.1 TIM barrel protein [Luteibacter aegosomatissinici]